MADFNPPPRGENNDTGFGIQANQVGERFINKDGSFNIVKTGYPGWKRTSIFSRLQALTPLNFLLLLLATYLVINFFFTLLYLIIDINELSGFVHTSFSGKMLEAFYFSTQTFTTVGYGRINPVGDLANIIASFEAMTGWIFFAMVAGISYGRFARPRAYLHFSQNALIAPYKNGKALMMRVVPFKNDHHLTNSSIRVNAALLRGTKYHFYNLELERSHVDALSTNWTIVHPINENSPLYDMNQDDFANADLEVYVLIDGFDHIFSNTVIKRTSYTFNEIIHNARFLPMYHMSKDGSSTILELDKLNSYEMVK